MKRKALFPGSFDPFTIGHFAIVKRSLLISDELIIAIGNNPQKKTLFSIDERVERVNKIFENNKNITVLSYDTLTSDFAKKLNVNYIIKGIRNINDFEFEKNMADVNRKLSGIETIFLISEPELSSISSALVRELIIFNKDISHLIPIAK